MLHSLLPWVPEPKNNKKKRRKEKKKSFSLFLLPISFHLNFEALLHLNFEALVPRVTVYKHSQEPGLGWNKAKSNLNPCGKMNTYFFVPQESSRAIEKRE